MNEHICQICGEKIEKPFHKLFTTVDIKGKKFKLLFDVTADSDAPAEFCENCLYEMFNLWNHDARRSKPELWDDDEEDEYIDEEVDEFMKHIKCNFSWE